MTRFIPGASEVDSISKFKRMLMGKKQQKTKSRGSSLSGIRCRISWTSSLPLPKRVTILNLGYSYREESGKLGEQNRKKLVKLTPFKVKVVKVSSFKVKVMELKEVKNTTWSSTGTPVSPKTSSKTRSNCLWDCCTTWNKTFRSALEEKVWSFRSTKTLLSNWAWQA